VNLEDWKEELGTGLVGEGGGEEGEVDEIGMIRGEAEGPARPLEEEEPPLRETPRVRMMESLDDWMDKLGREL